MPKGVFRILPGNRVMSPDIMMPAVGWPGALPNMEAKRPIAMHQDESPAPQRFMATAPSTGMHPEGKRAAPVATEIRPFTGMPGDESPGQKNSVFGDGRI